MKESEYLDMMNGLDARYADETVSRFRDASIPEAEAEFTAVTSVRRPRRIFAGLMTAGAAAVCVLTLTVLLPKLRNNPEVLLPQSGQSAADTILETSRNFTEEAGNATSEDGNPLVTTAVGMTEIGSEQTAANATVTSGGETVNTTAKTTDSTVTSAAQTGTTVGYTVSTSEPPVPMMGMDSDDGPYVLWVPDGYHGTVTIRDEKNGSKVLTAEQSAHMIKLMHDEKLVTDEKLFKNLGSSADKYLDSHLTVKLNDTDVQWDLYRFKVADLDIVSVNGKYYKGRTADAISQIRQYAEFCMDDEFFVIHLPSGYTGQASVYALIPVQAGAQPVALSSEDTGHLLKLMTETKLTEIPTPELPTGGPIVVSLDGCGITWNIHTSEIVEIDKKFYRDSSGKLKDLEMYALGFLSGIRAE